MRQIGLKLQSMVNDILFGGLYGHLLEENICEQIFQGIKCVVEFHSLCIQAHFTMEFDAEAQ